MQYTSSGQRAAGSGQRAAGSGQRAAEIESACGKKFPKFIAFFNASASAKTRHSVTRSFAVLLASAILAGCASITSDSTQLIRVDALDEQGDLVEDAKCSLKNNKGEYMADAGRHVQIGKSGKSLDIKCTTDERRDVAVGTAISRAGAGMYGNIIFGGGIGAIIDHNKGNAYNYPEWMQVVFGRILIFDRRDHQEGIPTPGKPFTSDKAEP